MKQIGKIVLLFSAICFAVFYSACDSSEDVNTSLSFESIEAEFGFAKPLTEKSKQVILERFGSLETYREHLLQVMKKRENNLPDKVLKSEARYRCELVLPNYEWESFTISSREYVLDRAEELGIDLQYSCRAGACSTCAARKESGEIDQSEQNVLNDYQISLGYCLLCVTYQASNCRFKTHQEEYLPF